MLTYGYIVPTLTMPKGLISYRWGFRVLEQGNPLSRRIEDLMNGW
jgi:hypothetical protein